MAENSNFENYPVAEECAKSYKEILNYLNICRSNPKHSNLVNECKVFCEKSKSLNFFENMLQNPRARSNPVFSQSI